jgi:hypothetical protein
MLVTKSSEEASFAQEGHAVLIGQGGSQQFDGYVVTQVNMLTQIDISKPARSYRRKE